MASTHSLCGGRARRAIAAAMLLATALTGCAAAQRSGNDPRDGSDRATPNTDYHGFPYNIQAG
jgi:hypothetical protein